MEVGFHAKSDFGSRAPVLSPFKKIKNIFLSYKKSLNNSENYQ
jgi:hypothetical protein